MANCKSALKRIKVTKTQTARNRMARSEMRTHIKKYEQALASNDLETAKKLFVDASKKIDMSVTKGVIHKNAAARKKSKMALAINKAI